MTTFVSDIIDFHQKFMPGYNAKDVRTISYDIQRFRLNFMKEELAEYERAVEAGDLEGALDALIDLQYVLLGTAYLHGFLTVFEYDTYPERCVSFTPFEEGWRRVHEANMAKVPAHQYELFPAEDFHKPPRHKNDVIKLKTWTPPQLSDLVGE